MTRRELIQFISSLGPPGFVLDFTRATLEDFIFNKFNFELEEYTTLGNSNGKRLLTLLMEEPKHTDQIVAALREHQVSL